MSFIAYTGTMYQSWYQSSIKHHSSINHQSSIINHQSSSISYQSSIISHHSIIDHRSSIINHQPSIILEGPEKSSKWTIKSVRKPSETIGNLWKPAETPLETLGNRQKPVETLGNLWKPWKNGCANELLGQNESGSGFMISRLVKIDQQDRN